MKLRLEKLLFLPALFEEDLTLLPLVLKHQMECEETVASAALRRVYTRCDCPNGRFFHDEVTVAGHRVEIFACEGCLTWSMAVTY